MGCVGAASTRTGRSGCHWRLPLRAPSTPAASRESYELLTELPIIICTMCAQEPAAACQQRAGGNQLATGLLTASVWTPPQGTPPHRYDFSPMTKPLPPPLHTDKEPLLTGLSSALGSTGSNPIQAGASGSKPLPPSPPLERHCWAPPPSNSPPPRSPPLHSDCTLSTP